MAEVHVRPERIHLAARKVDGAGQDWGESVEELTAHMDATGDPYGGDGLGGALKEMYEAAGPAALTYFTETGFCVVETSVAMNQLADAYTRVEADNTEQATKVEAVLDSLGSP
jgi:hypothetical protein